jgi:hypothetical protein
MKLFCRFGLSVFRSDFGPMIKFEIRTGPLYNGPCRPLVDTYSLLRKFYEIDIVLFKEHHNVKYIYRYSD